MNKIDEIKQAIAAATPGPWESKENRHPELNGNPWGWIDSRGGQIGTWSGSRNANYRNDNNLIARSPEWLAYLIGEVERYREALERVCIHTDTIERRQINWIAHQALEGSNHEGD